MDCGVAVGADGLEVLKAPGVILEVGLAEADLEGADLMVDLVRRGQPPLFQAFLAEAAVADHHLLTQRSPAAVVIDQLVAALVVAGGFLGLVLRTVNAGHFLFFSE